MKREQWLEMASELIMGELIWPEVERSYCGIYERPEVRIGVAPLSQRKAGVCYTRGTSDGGWNEIFINSCISCSIEVLGVLIHELIHAIDDGQSGHEGFFKKVAMGVGLEGKMTATVVSDGLRGYLRSLVDVELGEIPHESLNGQEVGKKKQENRWKLLKCDCCGAGFRMTRKWIEQVDLSVARCLVCEQIGLREEE